MSTKFGLIVVFAASAVILLAHFGYRQVYAEPIVVANERFGSDSDGALSMVFSPTKSLKVLKLDSVTSPESISYYELFRHSDGMKYLVLLNSETRTLYYYDFASGTLVDTILLDQYGFSYSDRIQGFHFLSDDSVLVYNYGKCQLTLLSLSNGRIWRRSMVDFYDKNDLRKTAPYVDSRSPIIFNAGDSTILLSGFLGDEGGTKEIDKTKNVLCAFSLKSGERSYGMPYPEFYAGGNWAGFGGYRQASFALIPGNKLVFSFMADHRIRIYDLVSKETKSEYAGSKHIREIRSMSYAPNYFDFIPATTKRKYYLSSPSYFSIHYDPFNKVYYRFAHLPITDVIESMFMVKPVTVIVLNSSFEKIGEVSLSSDDYDITKVIIMEEGIYIRKLTSSEDELVFQHFVVNTSLNRIP